MARVMPEQIDAAKRDAQSAEVAHDAPSQAASATPRGPQQREAGELDEDALDQVSGGRIN